MLGKSEVCTLNSRACPDGEGNVLNYYYLRKISLNMEYDRVEYGKLISLVNTQCKNLRLLIDQNGRNFLNHHVYAGMFLYNKHGIDGVSKLFVEVVHFFLDLRGIFLLFLELQEHIFQFSDLVLECLHLEIGILLW